MSGIARLSAKKSTWMQNIATDTPTMAAREPRDRGGASRVGSSIFKTVCSRDGAVVHSGHRAAAARRERRIERLDVEYVPYVIERLLGLVPDRELLAERIPARPTPTVPRHPELRRIERARVTSRQVVALNAEMPRVDHRQHVAGHREHRVHARCKRGHQHFALRRRVVAGEHVSTGVRRTE